MAARLLWEIAEAGMARSSAHFLCDDEANPPLAREAALCCSAAAQNPHYGKWWEVPAQSPGSPGTLPGIGGPRRLGREQYSGLPEGR